MTKKKILDFLEKIWRITIIIIAIIVLIANIEEIAKATVFLGVIAIFIQQVEIRKNQIKILKLLQEKPPANQTIDNQKSSTSDDGSLPGGLGDK